MSDTVLSALPRVMSRFNFKLVPVDAAFTRGRWRCWDYADAGVLIAGRATGPPPPALNRSDMLHFKEPGGSSADVPSPGAVACMSFGHDENAAAPLSPIMDELMAANESAMSIDRCDKGPAGSGGVGASSVANIDNKIEQAMDLVKTHLMYAVHEEVESLRGRIADLECVVVRLEAENGLLRKCAPQELVDSLPPPAAALAAGNGAQAQRRSSINDIT